MCDKKEEKSPFSFQRILCFLMFHNTRGVETEWLGWPVSEPVKTCKWCGRPIRVEE